VVLRPRAPHQSAPELEQLQDLGLHHVEIAWQDHRDWPAECSRLIRAFPSLALGAASLCTREAIRAAVEAGFRYGVSPILDASLLEEVRGTGFTLVPGVMTPSEVHRARSWGCSVVKLFPAASVGSGHWRRLRDPLGGNLPFCIAAGGLAPNDVGRWLDDGVDAVALGSALLAAFTPSGEGGVATRFDPSPLRALLATLRR
jgi:2-dehydro-3-deoxyphosphogluconate aldolase/(4S)-4-hydroxy-2-oxoglutarate aldolase